MLPQPVLPRQPLVGEGSPCHCQASLAYRTQGALPQPLVGRTSPAGQQLTNDLGGSKDPLVHRTKCSSQASAPWLPPALLWQDPPGVLSSHMGSRRKEGVSGPSDEEHLLGVHARGSHLTPSVAGVGGLRLNLEDSQLTCEAVCHQAGAKDTGPVCLLSLGRGCEHVGHRAVPPSQGPSPALPLPSFQRPVVPLNLFQGSQLCLVGRAGRGEPRRLPSGSPSLWGGICLIDDWIHLFLLVLIFNTISVDLLFE